MKRTCNRLKCKNLPRKGGRGFCNKHYQVVPKGFVDPVPCRQHLAALKAAGYSYNRLAKMTGLSRYCLNLVAAETFRRVALDTHKRITAVPLPNGFVAGGSQDVPNVGTRRRLLSLMAAGHSQYALAAELGVTQQCVAHWERVPAVSGATAARVAALFERLQLVPGTSGRAATWAKRKGGFPPLAWDLESIDDPNARPHVPRKSGATRLDEYRDLKSMGLTDRRIAERMGIKYASLTRMLLKAS